MTSLDLWSGQTVHRAEQVMISGWHYLDHPAISLVPPIEWATADAHRSWSFYLHSWDALSPVISSFAHTQDERYLQFARRVAVDWAIKHSTKEARADGSFAWYDMAVGLRCHKLGYVLDACVRFDSEFTDDEASTLMTCLLEHLDLLSDDNFIAFHSNHGFFQVAGQLATGRRYLEIPFFRHHASMARDRLRALISRHFTSEGIHKEHSPGYYLMLLNCFTAFDRAGLLDGESLTERLARSQCAFSWFVLPDGSIAMFGDTDARELTEKSLHTVMAPTLQHALSQGERGTPSPSDMAVFRESGYAIVRRQHPGLPYTQSSYLAQTCAFHSRVHKHADDLSFIWFDEGHLLMGDSGRFGYLGKTQPDSQEFKDGFWYSHPARQYVESTRAHNTVEIDHGNRLRTRVTPYGSALQRVVRKEQVIAIEAHVRQHSIRHARLLFYSPRQWLLVLDWLWDSHQEPHHFAQRFHLAPELELTGDGGDVSATIPGSSKRLHTHSLLTPNLHLDVTKGQKRPFLLGWVSREPERLKPCYTISYEIDQVASWTFATLFSLSESPPVPTGINRCSRSGRAGRFMWELGDFRHDLQFSRPEDGPFSVSYETS